MNKCPGAAVRVVPPPPALEIHKPRFSCHISATTPEIHISYKTTSHIHPAATTAGRDSAETLESALEHTAKTKHCYRVQHVRALNVSDSVMIRGAGRAHTLSLFQLSNWLNRASPVGVLRYSVCFSSCWHVFEERTDESQAKHGGNVNDRLESTQRRRNKTAVILQTQTL